LTDLASIRDSWDNAARQDAMWNIVTDPRYVNGGWDAEEFFAHGRRGIEGAIDRLACLDLPWTGDRALDFGCGIGRLTSALRTYFIRVDGVDISEEMVNRAHPVEGCFYSLNTTPDLDQFSAETFDLVYSMIVLQHMPPEFQQGYVREFFRVLKPGGVAMFQIPEGPTTGHPGHHLSMYGVPRETVEAWITEVADLVDVENLGCEADWTSLRYTATR